MPLLNEQLSQGVVTARDPHMLTPGELQRAVGGFYKPGDPRLWKQSGRAVFGDTGSAARIKGLKVLQFDTGGSDLLVALSGTVLYGAVPGLAGTFASIKTGLDTTATRLSAAQFADRWYLATDGDADRLFVIESDGSVYDAGMQPYADPPLFSQGSTAATTVRPDAVAGGGGGVNTALAYDGNDATFATLSRSSPGTVIETWTWSTGASASYRLVVDWALSGLGFHGDEPYRDRPRDTGAVISPGFHVTLKIEMSEDDGANYSVVLHNVYSTVHALHAYATELGTFTGANGRIRFTLTYDSGLNQATWRIHDIRLVTAGSGASTFSTTTGFYYAVTEYDSSTGERSSIKNSTPIVQLSSQNHVIITRPTQVNSRADYWEVWRTEDGGVAPNALGKIAEVPIAETTFTDDFVKYPASTTGVFKYPMLRVVVDDGILQVDRDQPPPQMDRVMSFQGALLAIKGQELRYSLAGSPGSWPEIYGISAFESEEHDTLVTGADLGEVFILGGVANLRRIAALPKVAIGNFAYAAPEIIAGAPGCVGAYSMARVSSNVSMGGITATPVGMVAWISHDGIYLTNGFGYTRISDDWDWAALKDYDKSAWALHWDRERHVLIVAYSSTGGASNDRYALCHLHNSHIKQNGQPKWTLDHYGSYSALDSALVDGARRLYSGHTSDGKVYLENYGALDASESYSGTTLLLDVLTRRIHGGESDFSALKAWLRHTDFGDTGSCTVVWTVGRDEHASYARTQTVALNGQRRTLFDVARAGEWHSVGITHTAASTGALADLSVEVRGLGQQGFTQAVS